VVEGRFCRGFCENARPERGFFVVNLWWIDGNRGVDTMFFGLKNATFLNLFFRLFLLIELASSTPRCLAAAAVPIGACNRAAYDQHGAPSAMAR
jgi:hypothetical protein